MGQKSPAQVAKELHGAQALLGKKTIGIPGPNSTPEEQRAYHQARGVPDAAEGYDLTATLDEIKANLPEGMGPDENREKQFKAWAKASNLSNGEANALVRQVLTDEMNAQRETMQAARAADTQTENMVTEKWGADREAKEVAANAFARHIGFDDDAMDAFMKLAGVKPEVRFNLVNFFAEQGALLEEGGGPGPGGSAPLGGMSREQAATAITQYLAQGDNNAAYMDSSHPRAREVEAHMTRLIAIRDGIELPKKQ